MLNNKEGDREYIVITFIISRYTHKGFISYLQTSYKLHNRSKLSNLKRKSAVVVTEFTLGILNIKVIFVWIHWIPYNIHTPQYMGNAHILTYTSKYVHRYIIHQHTTFTHMHKHKNSLKFKLKYRISNSWFSAITRFMYAGTCTCRL